MQKMLVRGRVLCGDLCQLFSLICISFCFLYLKAGAAEGVAHRLGGGVNTFQNEHPVTLIGDGIPLRAVFKAIKKQTGFAVMYSTSATSLNQDEKVTVNFKETPLDDVLGALFKGRNLEWQYSDDILLIRKKEVVVPKKSDVDSTVTPVSLIGKVTDGSGQPLPGVTVQVKGKNLGTTTDADGRFLLPKVQIGEALVMSSVGFEKREVVVKGKSLLVTMNLQVSTLDEKVVIAYGTTTQRLSTGNIATIKAKDIERQPVNNPLLALQGRVPGLFITQANGLPTGGITVRIQGQNSFVNGNGPLYVVDGVPYPSELPPGFGLAPIGNSGGVANGTDVGTGNALSYINPSDIESIDVLKDADATAIFGSRAANGAILITTKKGKVGKMTFDVNMQHGWGKVTRKLDMLNTKQYVEMRKEAFANDGITPTADNAPDLFLWDTTHYTDWQKKLLGGTARYTNLNVGLSGGTAFMQYLVRGTYQKETSVFPGNFADHRGVLHFSISSSSSNQKFNFHLSGNYLADNNKLPSQDLTRNAIQLEPNAPILYNADGSLNWMPDTNGTSTWDNPLAMIYKSYQGRTNNLVSNMALSYQILPNLTLRSSLGYNNIQVYEYQLNPLTAIRPEYRPFSQRYAIYSNKRVSSWIMEPQLTYVKKIGKGDLDFLLGVTIQQNSNNGEILAGSGHNSDLVLRDIKSAASLRVSSSFSNFYKYAATFSRLNYNWQNKYIINLTARRDGSSRFGPRNRLSNFGAIGCAWIYTEENFLKDKHSFLSFGKLRASYGLTGSDQLSDYSFMSLYNPVNIGIPYQGTLGLVPYGLPNPYLEWEETRKLQFGLDMGLLTDRILMSLSYSRNRSSNQLLNYALPSITGQEGIYRNFPATVQNTSFELSLSTINIKKIDFNWSSNVNLTIPRNKLVAFPDLASSTYAKTYFIGHPMSSIDLVYHFLGTDPSTGEYLLADVNKKPTTTPNYLEDRTVLINTLPKFYGGIQNSINYKGFQFDMLFQFVKQKGSNVIFANSPFAVISPGGFYPGYSNQPTTVLNRWQRPGDNTNIQRYSVGLLTAGNALLSDAIYSDASYVRLKNLSISWQLPDRWKRWGHLKQCRIYLHGQNLVTITNYKGLDPETRTVLSLPPLKILTIGFQTVL